MTVEITEARIKNILTRTTGYLKTVTSHSLQPYRGCTFGNSLCGVGCYVQHNGHVLKGRTWGQFLEVRSNAADSYLDNYEREKRWAHRRGERFSIFCSSATDPFVAQEFRYGVTRSLLDAMRNAPPDLLILQTHSHRARDYIDLCNKLAEVCQLRLHMSIESDRDRLPGLPPPASSVKHRFETCEQFKQAGIATVVTVAPLLPIGDPESFFGRIAKVADAAVIDHFIEGDGSANGSRTMKTELPEAMSLVDPHSVSLEYRDHIVEIARRHLPGRVGISIDGFAGIYA